MISIMIPLKGTIGDFFYNLLSGPRTVSKPYAQVAKVQLCASYVQHIECLSHAVCCVPHGTKGQLSCEV